MMNPASRAPLPRALTGLAIAAVALVSVPVVITVAQALWSNPAEVRASLQGTDVAALLLRTLLVAAIVTPVCGIFGLAAAWLVERTDIPAAGFWALFLTAPIAIPLFITSYAWSSLGTAFNGFFGGICVVAFSYYPIVFLLATAALRSMDPALEESARSLGCGAWRLYWRVIFPQLRPALLGGLLIIALDTLVEFDAFVGVHASLFVFNIYDQYRISFSSSGAAVLSLFSVATCVVILAVEVVLRRNANYVPVRRGTQRPALRYHIGGRGTFALLGLLIFVAIAAGIPIGTMIAWLMQATPHALAAAPAGPAQLLPATITSLLLGAVAAVLGLLLALPVAMLASRHRGVRVTLLERGMYLSFALPDLVAAVALAWVMSHLFPGTGGNAGILVVAYAILFAPIALLALRVSFAQLDIRLEEAARAQGCSPLHAWIRVGFPLAKPGIVAAGVLIFAFVLSDLSTTQVLIPAGWVTLGTQFWADAAAVAFGAAAPYAAVLIALAMGATYLLMSRFGRVRLSS